jgi:hypothetical protein
VVRALVYTNDDAQRRWLEAGLAQLGVEMELSRNVAELVCTLIDNPPPRPQLLFIDFSVLTPGELLHLHTIREHGWFGTVIALGKVSLALRQSLVIDKMLEATGSLTALRNAVANVSHGAQTIRVPRING